MIYSQNLDLLRVSNQMRSRGKSFEDYKNGLHVWDDFYFFQKIIKKILKYFPRYRSNIEAEKRTELKRAEGKIYSR